ncbi:ABC transporter CDR4 [Aspergillus terreus NIH2624]|uniref:ABC transporter CDR4 n=1 Tax=Aspergillus terreus (strain NIH 2624 / FGSC A1156) TaxID=341663 RepID=Q0CBQ6_ASPTN|nr:ABC transporter CDR4 [Aspergillus terreus NIH2624]EAU31010.1 ABC transporter CDR4 [Aspergillus terreus NIH2624]
MLSVGSQTLDNDDHMAQETGNAENDPTPISSSDSAASSDHKAEAAQSRNDVEEMARRGSLVQNLARTFTSESQHHRNGNIFTHQTDPNSPLNPNSPSFNARTWARALADKIESSGGSVRTSGVCFQNMTVSGYSAGTRHQKNVTNVWLEAVRFSRQVLGHGRTRAAILRDFDGVVHNGEMLVVLGPPGSGCTTFLKTLAGETNGLFVDEQAYFNYRGVSAKEMHTQHRGDAIYTAEIDVHFPMLSVGETLTFASRARTPRHLPPGVTPSMFSDHLRDVVMAMFGISHTKNTRVGNEYIRGVSGGERKRVTISEASLSGAPFQCWDNSTRGLDSANAVEFCRTLRLQSEIFRTSCAVSIYQAPQAAYDLFDKATVLYEGRQIFFGRADEARQYFIDLGFECPERQTTPDFLTSMTSPSERLVRPGFENTAPRTPDEFATAWRSSQAYQRLQAEIEAYKTDHPINGADAQAYREIKHEHQARGQRAKSPYTLSYRQQIGLCLWRAYRRFIGDPSLTVGQLGANIIMGLIVSSVFYNLDQTTGSFFQRSALLFFAVLMNAFSSALEILTLYAQRGIVEKHDRYAFYHPSCEAIASALMDMPYKVLNTIAFNLIISVLAMSGIFRTIGSASRTLSQAMVPAAVLILALVMFTGFVIPIDYMLGWSRWINYIDPMAYIFEALMINEFAGRQFLCTSYVPSSTVAGYEHVSNANRICSAVGAVPGNPYVEGTDYIESSFQYYPSHKWRNIGIVIGFIVFFHALYMMFTELITAKKSEGEVLVFRRGHKPAQLKETKSDPETGFARSSVPVVVSEKADGSMSEQTRGAVQESTSVFHWSDVCYDVSIKGNTRRILDHVDGWVKPGTLTALMGVSGAGKTTLLDCLADRVSMGVITGEVLVDGTPRSRSFQRETGYVQQQDLHLETTTVREALNFSALLRQPGHLSRQEKLAYVDEVIKLLDMQEYADAVVGVPGEGLNVEQRKRLTIGVELAAKPRLLVFVDEPTSGLDSQTSWAILDLLQRLTKSGQAVLCTIHQPSSMLFQRFDRLLLLASGGRTVYFGDIGESSEHLISYFERNGAPPCPQGANPAEWMLEAIGAAPGSSSKIDWHATWKNSPEYQVVKAELERLRIRSGSSAPHVDDEENSGEFAAPFHWQLWEVTHRVFQQYWRTPSYIYSKASLVTLVSAFIAYFLGFAFFKAPNTVQGLQNQMFAIFNLLTVFGQLVQQTMPYFVIQRSLYEVRERPSKVYSWKVFMLSQIIVEIPWNTLMSVIMFLCFYYPIGLYQNAEPAHQVTERGALFFLFLWAFMMFTCTFTDFIIAGVESAEQGGNVANLLFMLCLIFCGVLATPSSFPHFWIFMYRVSPFTYMVQGMMTAAVANTDVVCAANELLHFPPPAGQTCGQFLQHYIDVAGGYLQDSNATDVCTYCTIGKTNVYLAGVDAFYDQRWRNFGIFIVYVVVNIFGALFMYWLARVPKKALLRWRKK